MFARKRVTRCFASAFTVVAIAGDSVDPIKLGFPLASIALLTTVLAGLLACVDVERLHHQLAWLHAGGPWRIALFVGGAAVFGAIIAITILFATGFRWRLFFIATLVGIVAGQLGLLLLMAPAPIWRAIFAVGVLVISAVVFRAGAE
jgi:hypothetical protein